MRYSKKNIPICAAFPLASIAILAAAHGEQQPSTKIAADELTGRYLDAIIERQGPPASAEISRLDRTGAPGGSPDGKVDVRDLSAFINGLPVFSYFDSPESIVYHADSSATLTVRFTKPVSGTIRFTVGEAGDPAPGSAPPDWQPSFTISQSDVPLNNALSTQILINFPSAWRGSGGERVAVISLRRPPSAEVPEAVNGEVRFATHVLRVRQFDEAEYAGTLSFASGAGIPSSSVRIGLWKEKAGAKSGAITFGSETRILGDAIEFNYQSIQDGFPVFNNETSGIPVTLDGAKINRLNGTSAVPIHGHLKLTRITSVSPDEPLSDFLSAFNPAERPAIYSAELVLHNLLAAGSSTPNPFSVTIPGRLSLQKVVYEALQNAQP